MTTAEHHTGFATVLRAWRDRLRPAEVGLPQTPPRRATGLRREELARLGGISVDYLVRLEQGRATAPSPQVLASLARALRLTEDERAYLYRLAGLRPPERTVSSAALTDGVRRLLERRRHEVLGVYDAGWTLLSWTDMFAAVFGDPADLSRRDRNVLWLHFTARTSRIEHTAAAGKRFERAAVADLRASAARFPDDTAIAALVRDLRSVSPRFARLWASYAVGEHVSDAKTVHHPHVGPIALVCDVFTVPGSDARVVGFGARDEHADERLARVRASGPPRPPAGHRNPPVDL